MFNHLTIPQYLLESSFCLSIFYLFYLLMLKNETYFQLNRFYLIGTALFSLLIPFVNVVTPGVMATDLGSGIISTITEVQAFESGLSHSIENESGILMISLGDIIRTVYYIGVFLMTVSLLKGLFKLFKMIKSSTKLKTENHTFCLNDEVPAASFFSYIFWSKKNEENKQTRDIIMNHELVHVKQYHSFDVVLMEVMVIIKWFNPLIYLFRNSLRKTHEFIADRYVSEMVGDKLEYAKILIAENTGTTRNSLATPFDGHLKERLQMLSRNSRRSAALKALLVVPIAACLMALFSFNLTENLPTPITSSFSAAEKMINKATVTPLLSLQSDSDTKLNYSVVVNDEYVYDFEVAENETQTVEYTINLDTADAIKTLAEANIKLKVNGEKVKIKLDSIFFKNDKILGTNLSRESVQNLLQTNDEVLVKFRHQNAAALVNFVLIFQIGTPRSQFHRLLHQDIVLRLGEHELISGFNFKANDTYEIKSNKVTREEIIDWLGSEITLYNPHTKESIPLSDETEIRFSFRRSMFTIPGDLDFQVPRNEGGKKDGVTTLIKQYHGKQFGISTVKYNFLLSEFDQANFEQIENSILHAPANKGFSILLSDESNNYNFYVTFDEGDSYEPPFEIELPFINSESRWQMVNAADGKNYIRLDAENPSNKSIVEAYKGSQSYEVLHIKDFKAKTRIRESKLPTGELSRTPIEDYNMLDLNMYSLNDYVSSTNNLLRMDWGKMVSLPNIGNFSMKEFKRSSRNEPLLFEGVDNLKLMRFDVLIVPEEGKIKRIRTDKIGYRMIRDELDKIESNSSVYFDNIIIEKDHELFLYPYNFVFSVEI